MTMAVRRGDALTWRALPCPGQDCTVPARLGQLGRTWRHRRNLGHRAAVERFFDKVLGYTLWLLSQDNLEGAEQEKSGLGFLLQEEG